MSQKDGRVILSAWVDPTVRDVAREYAKISGLEFSVWVARAIMRATAKESSDRAIEKALKLGECLTCGYSTCLCDQQ